MFRLVDGNYQKSEKYIRENYKGDKKHFNYENILKDMKQFVSYKRLENELNEEENSIKQKLNLMKVNVKEIREIQKWIQEIKKKV